MFYGGWEGTCDFFLSHSNEITNHSNEIIYCSNDIVSRSYEILSRSNEITFSANKKIIYRPIILLDVVARERLFGTGPVIAYFVGFLK